MPADYGFRFHDNENFAPARPEATKRSPEQSVQGTERWPRPLSFENGDLLPKREDLESRIGSAAEENAHGSEDSENALSHEMTVVTDKRVVIASRLNR